MIQNGFISNYLLIENFHNSQTWSQPWIVVWHKLHSSTIQVILTPKHPTDHQENQTNTTLSKSIPLQWYDVRELEHSINLMRKSARKRERDKKT